MTACRQNAISMLETMVDIKENELVELKEFLEWLKVVAPKDGSVESVLYDAILALNRR